MSKYKQKIVIIGSVPHQGNSSTFGGTTVLMRSFLDYCKNSNINFQFIQANKHLHRFNLIRNYFRVVYLLVRHIKSSNAVMINASNNGALYLSPLVFIISKIYKKKFVFRMFGGNFCELYGSINFIKKIILNKTILKSDFLFFETKEIVDYVTNHLQVNTNVLWLPNVRKKTVDFPSPRNFRKRFVFISHVKKSKGIFEILECSNKLSSDYVIDVYGPFADQSLSESDFNRTKVRYKGVIDPNKVIDTLKNYDVLLLPTYHDGEGYPGIIIEAMSLGIPSITTNWKSIPELISDKKNGILIEPKNVNSLFNAIISINEENYMSYASNALSSFSDYDENIVYLKVLNTIQD